MFVRDITEKKELQRLLNEANSLARIGGWEIDLEKKTVYWSEITQNIHKVAADYQPDVDEMLGFYKEGESRQAMVAAMESAAQYGTPADIVLQIVTARGNTIWVRVIMRAGFKAGKCTRLYGSIQDIDSRRKAEIASVNALQERNTILESIADAFFAVDDNWVVTYWNNMAEKVLHVPKDKILNHNLWEIFADATDTESYKRYHEAMRTGEATHFEDYYPTLNRWYEISGYPADNGLSVYFKDITDRKLWETQLKELNKNLQKNAKELAISNAELEQFAYVASHDLQEPLRMVTSFLTQLEKKYSDVVDDKGRQYIYFAVDGAKRMRQIILDLLDFSRVGRTENDLEEIDLNKVVNEICGLYHRQIEELEGTVEYHDLPRLTSYKTPIRQIFQNLIGNSLKYHSRDRVPRIEITSNETDSMIEIAVKDNGIGIAEEYFEKIFIIFQRLHNREEYSGTGMGLAIAKKIIENMGGKIWVESKEGEGTTFYFTLQKNMKQ
jgi:PAS domain S-box-containing protein